MQRDRILLSGRAMNFTALTVAIFNSAFCNYNSPHCVTSWGSANLKLQSNRCVTMTKLPTVASGILEDESGSTIDLKTKRWVKWLETAKSFRYCPKSSDPAFTVRKEGQYWYGYRKQQGKLHKRYVGKADELTVAKLEETAKLLNVPSEPRQKATPQTTATTTEYVTRTEMQQLHEELAALREQVSELVGK